MKFQSFPSQLADCAGGLLVLVRFEDEAPGAAERWADEQLGAALSRTAERRLFKGGAGQKVGLDTLGRILAERVLLLGLGKRDALKPALLRDAGAFAAQEAQAQRLDTVWISAPEGELSLPNAARELLVGLRLGAWQYTTLQTPNEKAPRPEIKTAAVQGADEAAQRGAALLADGVELARQLTNEPPHVCTPTRLGEVAEGFGQYPHVSVMLLDREGIEARGMGGLVAVSQGATEEPRFIHVHYDPPGADAAKAIALVGKGITFDSGGLSIKPMPGMVEMHMDMGGAAAVLGALHVLIQQQPTVALHGVIAACENMPDGHSYRPSDVLTTYSGKTVEVLNTDAEGRLVLADALHFAAQKKPRLIVDLATLTGACLVGLGQYYTALYSDDDAIAEEVAEAGRAADEKLWRMPLDPKLADSLKSKRADLSNLGGRWGGSITAAQFLQHFKGDGAWCHLDIAGPAMSDKQDGHICYGGTGFGVLTLVSLVEAAQRG